MIAAPCVSAAMLAVVSFLLAFQAPQAEPSVIAHMKEEAAAVRPMVQSKLALDWLNGVEKLPEPSKRVVYRNDARDYLSEAAWKALPEKDQAAYKKLELPAQAYYYTKYGTPLAYVRVMELASKHGLADLRGKSIADFGYGGIGHLQLSALQGARAVGIDVDSFLLALYSDPSDVGKLGEGSVQLVNGFWPNGEGVAEKVGGGYDLFVSKNTLKRGYIHPERPAKKEYLIDLGVTDEEYLKAVWKTLKQGGLFMVYNLSPAPSPPDKEFLPMTDGRFPFDRALCEKVGFEVLAFDEDDGALARKMGVAYGWGKPDDLEKNIFAHYTVLRKR